MPKREKVCKYFDIDCRLSSKKYWHHLLYTDAVNFFVIRKCHKIWKNLEILYNRYRKSSLFLKDLRNLKEYFTKDVIFDNIKSHLKQDFNLSLESTFMEKEGVCITASKKLSANLNLCFKVLKLQLKLINRNVCYLYTVWVNQIS